MARLPNGIFIAFPSDANQTPTTQAQILCAETMEATRSAMLAHTAQYALKAQAQYVLIPRWRLLARYKAWTEIRGALRLAKHLCNVELMP